MSTSMSLKKNSIVVGANGDIAQAIINELLNDDDNLFVYAISRKKPPLHLKQNSRLIWFKCDYEENSIYEICKNLNEHNNLNNIPFNRVFICNGILHDADLKPEKKIDDLNFKNFHKVINANSLIPLLWIKYLKPVLNNECKCHITVFNARVGSISDNKLGGWYTYRASKASLNMLLKNVSIEFSRTMKNIKIISFHPGTTDTKLSKPFQKNIADNKLFSPAFVANKLLEIISHTPHDGELSFVDWKNDNILW